MTLLLWNRERATEWGSAQMKSMWETPAKQKMCMVCVWKEKEGKEEKEEED